jgi:hypothetical protein
MSTKLILCARWIAGEKVGSAQCSGEPGSGQTIVEVASAM